MNGDLINRVLKDVHRITVAAGMKASEAAELHCRALGSLALAGTGNDRERAAAQVEAWAKTMADAIRDPGTKLKRAAARKGA